MKCEVYLKIPSCDPGLVKQLEGIPIADLHESVEIIPGRMGLMSNKIKPLARGMKAVGQAITIYCYPGDNVVVHRALKLAKPGQILVFAGNGYEQSTMFGDLMGMAAQLAGVAGIVVDGSIRDTDILIASKLPIWCASVYVGHSEKRGPGAVNVPIVCGGAVVEPGDVIVADSDGVMVIPPAQVPSALANAKARAAKEENIRARMQKGELLFDLMGVDPNKDLFREHDKVWNQT